MRTARMGTSFTFAIDPTLLAQARNWCDCNLGSSTETPYVYLGLERDGVKELDPSVAPPGVDIAAINLTRQVSHKVDGAAHVLANDALAGLQALNYWTDEVFDKYYNHFFPEAPRPTANEYDLRVRMLQKWTSKTGTILPQTSNCKSFDTLLKFLQDSDTGNKYPEGHALERVLSLSNIFDNAAAAHETYKPANIATMIIRRLASLDSGEASKTTHPAVWGPLGKRSFDLLSKLLDHLPNEVQAQIPVIESDDPALEFLGELDTDNASMSLFWSLVLAHLAVFSEAFRATIPAARQPDKDDKVQTALTSMVEQMQKTAKLAILGPATTTSTSTAIDIKLSRSKSIDIAEGDTQHSVLFRKVIDRSMQILTEFGPALALALLRKNPDAARLLMLKLPPSTSGASKYLAHIASMREHSESEMEHDLDAIHRGRISHAEAEKIITRTLGLVRTTPRMLHHTKAHTTLSQD